MEGCFMFQWGRCFSDGGASFLSGVRRPMGGISFGGGWLEKNCKMPYTERA